MIWMPVCTVEDIPMLGSRVVQRAASKTNIAVFRTSKNEVFALLDQCPHKKGPLSQGIVHGQQVTCPLHAWNIDLASGNAQAPDNGCTARFSVHVDKGIVHLLTSELESDDYAGDD